MAESSAPAAQGFGTFAEIFPATQALRLQRLAAQS
jgi:hypothetical protein